MKTLYEVKNYYEIIIINQRCQVLCSLLLFFPNMKDITINNENVKKADKLNIDNLTYEETFNEELVSPASGNSLEQFMD